MLYSTCLLLLVDDVVWMVYVRVAVVCVSMCEFEYGAEILSC